jgi:hypothetical protein
VHFKTSGPSHTLCPPLKCLSWEGNVFKAQFSSPLLCVLHSRDTQLSFPHYCTLTALSRAPN